MPSVADLVEPTALKALAAPSDYRLGEEIVANDSVELEEFGPTRVVAHATGGQRRLVELTAGSGALEYTCTCNSNLSKPCKHVVAVGLVTWEKSPKRLS
jgi:uncharacterized Zn finger protein